MTERIKRRDALKLGTSAAVSAAISPLLSNSAQPRPAGAAKPFAGNPASTNGTSTSDSDICFLPAKQMADLVRQKKLSAANSCRLT